MKEPTTLWHYTDAAGFAGIVQTSQLRFGDVRFLNDRTERTYGEALLEKVLNDAIAKDTSGLAAQLRDYVSRVRIPYRLFVCSMSEHAESISQWQRYGVDGAGYCIGFDPRQLDDQLAAGLAFRIPMVYDRQKQIAILNDDIERGLAEYRRLEEEKNRCKVTYLDYVFSDIDGVETTLLQMKNPYFEDEKEWRYVSRIEDEVPLERLDTEPEERFGVRGAYVKPFFQLPRLVQPHQRLPITSVVCGPRLDTELAIATADHFIRSHGYDVPVSQSGLRAIWR